MMFPPDSGNTGDSGALVAELQAQLYRYAEDLYVLMSEHDELQQRYRALDRSYRSISDYRDLLTTLMYSASEAYLSTSSGQITSATRSAAVLFGSDELVGQNLRGLIAAESLAAFDEMQGEISAGDNVRSGGGRLIGLVNASGEVVEALVWIIDDFSVGAEAEQLHWLVRPMIQDRIHIYDRDQSRQELGGEAVFYADGNGRLLVVNDSFCRISGYQPEECLGQPMRILKSGVQGEHFYRMFWEALKGNGSWQGEIVNRRKSGELYPEWLSVASSRDSSGEIVGYFGKFHDLSRLHESEGHLSKLAYYDVLTGLPNRHIFQDRLKMAMSQARRSNTQMGLFFIDLDRFKQVNDTLGHDVGDELLKVVAQRLASVTREMDTVARLGGDEFTVILPNLSHERDAHAIATKILEVFQPPVQVGAHLLFPSPSIGIAMFPSHGTDEATLIRRADMAMYHAKGDGGNAFRVFEADDEGDTRVFSLESAFRQALDRGELYLVYQPQLSADGQTLHGVEALLRWRSPDFGDVSPNVFIPIAEWSGAIVEIGRWVIRTACAQMAAWREAGCHVERVAVNISPRQLRDANFTALVIEELEHSGLPAEALELEITESELMLYPESTLMKLDELRKRGLSIAIDDFGTGYSNLARLRTLPVDRIKVDRSFVQDLEHDGDAQAISTCIVTMAKVMKLDVVAEGVETAGQLRHLVDQGCTSVQGFLFAQPMLPASIENWIGLLTTQTGETNVA
ncbi:EAL domain-containing protein [Dechloromonas sp. ZS-1]|uniref:putative bifunctional diguanylate cyclase/phosphodiesterase n=1 Tax=Dechloromonas sp. ZS-1 TaxID=3138067 RepID=UPI0031FC2CFC